MQHHDRILAPNEQEQGENCMGMELSGEKTPVRTNTSPHPNYIRQKQLNYMQGHNLVCCVAHTYYLRSCSPFSVLAHLKN